MGLVGGIGPAATDHYYRRLISVFAQRKARLDATIVHADTPTLLRNLQSDDAAAQVRIYEQLTQRLAAAGASCVAITSIAGHFCIELFKSTAPLPVIDMVAEVNQAILRRGLRRIGILGTRTVMETRLYGRVPGATILAPRGSDLDRVHEAYVAMAATGVVTQEQRAVFDEVARRLLSEEGAEAIMLGGTDLALVYNEDDSAFPLIDCARIHVDAICKPALDGAQHADQPL